jgi:hypothetical protein
MGGRPTTMRMILVLLFEFLMLMERIAAADPHPREGRRERMIVVANLLKQKLNYDASWLVVLKDKLAALVIVKDSVCAVGIWSALYMNGKRRTVRPLLNATENKVRVRSVTVIGRSVMVPPIKHA